ncbi:MAG TPA: DUF1638 domain-containing protein [Methanomassiliicoccales archaeon]|nr:DUF1638 domain-containing protein [Methanomassiliicoccales archaeon]
MTFQRRLGIIGCPVLEDEIVYLLSGDKGLKDIFVVKDEHSEKLIGKLRRKGIEIVPTSEEGLSSLPDSQGRSVVVWMKSMGLHEEPKELGKEVARSAKVMDGHCATILLFYGLCGNAFKNMNLLFEDVRTPVVILTDQQGQIVDDCIAVPLGGTDGYLRLLKRYAGVFYMTPAWADNWELLINKMEIARGTEMGNLDMLKMLFEMAGYNRVLLIDTGLGDREVLYSKTREFSTEFNFKEVVLEPDFVSTRVSDDAYQKCLEMLENGKKE